MDRSRTGWVSRSTREREREVGGKRLREGEGRKNERDGDCILRDTRVLEGVGWWGAAWGALSGFSPSAAVPRSYFILRVWGIAYFSRSKARGLQLPDLRSLKYRTFSYTCRHRWSSKFHLSLSICHYFEKNSRNKRADIFRVETRDTNYENEKLRRTQGRMREEPRFESSDPGVTGVRSLGADHSLSVLRCTCHTASFIAFISLPSSSMPFVVIVHPAALHPVVHTFLYRSYSIVAFI